MSEGCETRGEIDLACILLGYSKLWTDPPTQAQIERAVSVDDPILQRQIIDRYPLSEAVLSELAGNGLSKAIRNLARVELRRRGMRL